MRAIVAVVFFLLIMATPAVAQDLLIAAGAGYKKPLTEVYAAFREATGLEVAAAFGNMQQVLAQTRDSGRVDLVVGEQGFLEKSGLFARYAPLGTGRLVLAYGRERLDGWEALTSDTVERIALPDPKKAIYGRAATQFLKRSGLLPKVEHKLMTLATVPQVSAYLVASTVDAGFINITDALGLGDEIAGFEEIPPELYDAPRIVLAVPAAAPEGEAAGAFTAFIASATARAIFERYGL